MSRSSLLGLVTLIAATTLLPQQPSAGASLDRRSSLVSDLSKYLARSRPTWPESPYSEKGTTLLGARRTWAVLFGGPGTAAFESDSAFANLTNQSDDCAKWPYRHFYVGGDTITFTYARIPEGCSESPGMIYRNARGVLERADMTPLFNWNVDAIWLTPHYLVFAATAEYESGLPQSVRIVCWELDTGRWFTSPIRGYLMNRPGFDLPALLPDWFTSRAFEIDGAVVLRGERRALALWPEKRAWSLVDASTGQPVPDRPGSRFRRVVPGPDQRLSPTLKSEIRRVFEGVHAKASRDVVEFDILDMIQAPCSGRRHQYAVSARALGRDRIPGGAELDWSRELFGVCILDSSLTHVVKSYPPFPSSRWKDTTVYFDLDAPGDSIVVWEEGATYADFGGRFAYSCAP